MRLAEILSAAALTVVGAGCAALGHSRDVPPGRPHPASSASRPPDAAPGQGLESFPLGELPAGTVGPFLGTSARARLAVWIEPGGSGGLFVRALDGAGAPQAAARRLAPAPSDAGLVAVRAAAGDSGGFLILTSSGGAGASSLFVQPVGASGETKGPAVAVVEDESPVLWMDVTPVGSGHLVTWATAAGGVARLRARSLDGVGVPRGAVRDLAARALAWQIAAVPGGLALGLVEPGKTPGRGSVSLQRFDEDALPRGRAVRVSEPVTAMPDLDLVALGEEVVLVWTDTRGDDPAVFLAVVDGSGRLVRGPERALGAVGAEALVRLVPPLAGGAAHLVWEPLSDRPPAGRAVRIAPVLVGGRLGAARAELAIAADGVLPQLVPTLRGLAALTLAPACPRGDGPAPERAPLGDCGAGAFPLFVAFDRELHVTATEPLRLEGAADAAATAAWGLSCTAQGCITLAALAGTPAPVYAVRLAARSAAWLSPAIELPPAVPPMAVGIRTLANVAPLADLGAASTGAGALAAWVTYFDPSTPWVVPKTPAPDGRFAPVRALLQVTRLDPTAAATTLSVRARSPGGVSLAPAADREEALVTWCAMDQGRPQVFGTLVSGRAQKMAQKMLTTTPGEKSDVAAVAVSDGWIVAWIDERDGSAAPFAAHFDRTLRRVGEEHRLTAGPTSASGVALAAAGSAVVVAWADARDPSRPGVADIYAKRLRAEDLESIGEVRRIASTRPHSYAPALRADGSAVTLAWLEASDPAAKEPAAVALARLEAGGLGGPVERVPLPGAEPTGLALDCATGSCRVAVGVEQDAGAAIEAFRWQPGAAPVPRRLLRLDGPSGQLVPLALAGDLLLVGDQTDGGGRVRALSLAW